MHWFFGNIYFDQCISLERPISMKLYVGNLPYTVAEEDLKELFATYGEVASVSLVTDRFSGQSKGFGFVEMPSNAEADQAIKSLNEQPFKGRNIKVNQAQDRPAGGRPGGGRPQGRPRY
jgi:RNA recognition motif-containing protein